MRCYFTGEECDCDNDMGNECPHDDMAHDEDDDAQDMRSVETCMSDMSERLECRRN